MRISLESITEPHDNMFMLSFALTLKHTSIVMESLLMWSETTLVFTICLVKVFSLSLGENLLTFTLFQISFFNHIFQISGLFNFTASLTLFSAYQLDTTFPTGNLLECFNSLCLFFN